MKVVPMRTTCATSAMTPTTTATTACPRRNQSRRSSTSTTSSRKSRRRSSAMKVEMPSTATTTAATDGGGDDYARIGLNDYCDPFKKEPGPKLGCDDGDADDDYGPPDVHDYRDYGSPEENPESKVIDVYHHPIKEEPEPGDGDRDAVNGYPESVSPKEEPELVAAGDDTDDDDCPDVGYDCSHCGISLSTREFNVEHELRCKVLVKRKELESQVTKLYHCRYCKCPFVNTEFKERHQQRWCRKRPVVKRKNSNDTYFKCDECEYVSKRKWYLGKHLLTHNKNNAEWFTCTQCSYKTVHKRSMTRHTKIHSDTFDCCCPICGKSFRMKQHLDDHLLRQHSDESDEVAELITNKVYKCNICDRFRTLSKTDFNVHLTVTHLKGVGGQKYQCPRCPYSTFYKGSLTVHSKTHEEQKNYQCTVCKKQFARKQGLDSHILYTYTDNVDLVKTITSKIHRCKSCSFKTIKTSDLKRHERTKHI